jgi:hypothetical protein
MAGRPKKSVIDVMRTKVWLAEMLRLTGLENENQFARLLVNVDSGKHVYEYRDGTTTPGIKKLEKIDEVIFNPKKLISKSSVKGVEIFEKGPVCKKDAAICVPLWDALEGTMEQVWSLLVQYDPPIALQRFMKDIPFKRRLAYVVFRCFCETDPPSYWEGEANTQENFVATAYAAGKLNVDLDLIAATIAAWRLAHFVGDSVAMMDYILIGLLDRAIPENLQQYGIDQDMLKAIGDLDRQYLAELDEAFYDFIYDAPTYPITEIVDGEVVHKGYDQPDTHGFLVARIKRDSVSEFLTQKNKTYTQPPAQATPSP